VEFAVTPPAQLDISFARDAGVRVASKIFVNYRREDAKAEAARLHDRLAQSFGADNVFMDVDNLLPGERFDLRLKEALAGTDVFLVVIGARWLTLLEARAESGERDYVREEIAAALAAKIVVIPVLMDRAPLPKAASLPGDIRELALYHKHDVVYESFGRDVQALIAAIEAHREARDEQAAEAARLVREKGRAEIEATRLARQKAKEEADAERRARMEKEARAKSRPEPAALPWTPVAAVAIAIMIAVILGTLLIYGPLPAAVKIPGIGNLRLDRDEQGYGRSMQKEAARQPQPSASSYPFTTQILSPPAPVGMSSEILAADAVAVPGQPTPLTITIRSPQPFEKMLVSIAGVPEGGRLNTGVDTGGGNWLLSPRRLNGLTIKLPAYARDAVSLEVQLLDSNARTPLSAKGTLSIRVVQADSAALPRSSYPFSPYPFRQ
jgi:hypothetical protein